jgi:serine/threonine protein kinase
LIHRDVKPDNFLLGKRAKQWLLYVIDYGLSKHFKDPKTGRHIPYRTNKDLTGTARYASLNTHIGIEQSRRDDLEGIANTLIYLLKGSLPWQNVQAKTKAEKYRRIKSIKLSTTPEMVCKGYPIEFITFLKYCRKLTFEEQPNYNYIQKLFDDLFIKENYACDYMYDWILMRSQSMNVLSARSSGVVLQTTGETMVAGSKQNDELVIDLESEDDKPQIVKPCIMKVKISCFKKVVNIESERLIKRCDKDILLPKSRTLIYHRKL